MGVPPPQWNWTTERSLETKRLTCSISRLRIAKIRRRDAVIFCDDHVAGAEQAKAFAEGQVHVERDGRARGFGLGVDVFEVVGAEGVLPDGRGGIAGVARARAIVAGEEFFGDAELLRGLSFESEFEAGREVAHVSWQRRRRQGIAPAVSSSSCAWAAEAYRLSRLSGAHECVGVI